MSRRTIVLAAVLMGCGGTTIVDGGAGGAGGTSSTSSTSSTSTTSTTTTGTGGAEPDCAQLSDALDKATAAARACDPCMAVPGPCTYPPGMELTDPCGCPIPVNSSSEAVLNEALDAYAAWTQADCGPFECGQPCAISTEPTCQPTGSGCTGVCGP